ncbi:RagB/SusD family nutrient uptake outer membrane protein [Chitinophaga nivalis]|uniref:RagB/SusD family nutrient uptake outer membrane protein n=1 Tax=Chitinophaga nivalis TaxID=2991709 RepID=A0ABT3IIR0_9BACT|nr:RagB/SusD family nutrient uptake outer membrane protein [Chitinophaga nivalis]MCW3466609.1 RagB/SusD family nutrient uptake outer membrane protein [Chitinophaga nivalis]MCW3483700.1 RagB/SusD family nutrient uptake outer membrane protein [Chitinophaga nivalis]
MKSLYRTGGNVILIMAMLVCSCSKSFLDKHPQSALQEDALTNKKGVTTLLVGAYAALDGQDFANSDMVNLSGGSGYAVSPDNWIYGSVCGGEAHKGSDPGDAATILSIGTFAGNATNGFFNDKWRVDYEGIRRCNFVLHILKKVQDMTPEEKTAVAGEARFLRAHYYSDLKKMFNKIPWVDENSTSYDKLNVNDFKIPNDKDVWPYIEADFKFAADNLPEEQPEIGRANKWAAVAYLAKSYLYQGKYAAAIPLFESVINSGKNTQGQRFDLVPVYHDNFDAFKENNEEAVFSIQYSANDGSGGTGNANQGNMLNYPYNGPFSCCGFYQPAVDLVNAFRTDAAGLPFIDNFNQHPIKNDMGIVSDSAFLPDAGNIDPRLDWTVGRRGVPYLDWGVHPGQNWVRDQQSAGPYSPKKSVYMQVNQDKFYDGNGWAPGNAINYMLIRFADVLLMAAECEVKAGDLGKAEAYVNRVRQRAMNPAGFVYTYKDPAHPMNGYTNTPAANYKIGTYPVGEFGRKGATWAMKAIQFERKLELAMEGHRFFDLVRWGLAATELNRYFNYERGITGDLGAASFGSRNLYFPIPQRQIDLSVKDGKSLLTQNTGY